MIPRSNVHTIWLKGPILSLQIPTLAQRLITLRNRICCETNKGGAPFCNTCFCLQTRERYFLVNFFITKCTQCTECRLKLSYYFLNLLVYCKLINLDWSGNKTIFELQMDGHSNLLVYKFRLRGHSLWNNIVKEMLKRTVWVTSLFINLFLQDIYLKDQNSSVIL